LRSQTSGQSLCGLSVSTSIALLHVHVESQSLCGLSVSTSTALLHVHVEKSLTDER